MSISRLTMNTFKRILPLYNKDLIDTNSESFQKNIALISCYINKAFDKILEHDNIGNEEEKYIDPEDQCYDFISIKIDSTEQIEKKVDDGDNELREIKIIS